MTKAKAQIKHADAQVALFMKKIKQVKANAEEVVDNAKKHMGKAGTEVANAEKAEKEADAEADAEMKKADAEAKEAEREADSAAKDVEAKAKAKGDAAVKAAEEA